LHPVAYLSLLAKEQLSPAGAGTCVGRKTAKQVADLCDGEAGPPGELNQRQALAH
jgi:hypothetical protein